MAGEAWTPVEGHLLTRWASEVDPSNPWPDYPRPKMVRADWLNLNGLWDYAIRPQEVSYGEVMPELEAGGDGEILVPFCAESALSGVGKRVRRENALWYRRTFDLPSAWNERVLLHFGAVDWECTVWVNGTKVGAHKGGYDPFHFDITEALQPGSNEIILRVWDPTSDGGQPRGKQLRNPDGIWYTPVSGIWQTVWLESVPESYIERMRVVPNIDEQTLTVTVDVVGDPKAEVWVRALEPCPSSRSRSPSVIPSEVEGSRAQSRAEIPFDRPRAGSRQARNDRLLPISKAHLRDAPLDAQTVVAEAKGVVGEPLAIRIKDPKLWSPDSPFLYDLEVGIKGGDKVKSYFGMRKISMTKDGEGIPRIALNNEIIFQYGPLDQGWWPDGLYTPANEAALLYDIEMTQKLGMNMIRKHVKVELERFYYHCDRMGYLYRSRHAGDRRIPCCCDGRIRGAGLPGAGAPVV